MSETNFTKIQSANKINEIYEGLSYFDQYGGSVFLFFILTIIVFVIWSYTKIIVNIQPIKDDWVNQRCNASIIPFAGIINPPEGKTATEFTQENFTYCTQNILTSIAGVFLAPINYIFKIINTLFEDILQALQYIRQLIDSIRQKFAAIAEEIYGRVSNTIFTFFPIIIKIKNALEESRAIMISGLYTSLGSYYTLKSLMGAIVQIAVLVLIALAILVVVMWLCFMWPVAAAGTAAWSVCAAFLIIIIVFCTDTLHISVPGMPSPPKKPSCFDEDTLLKMSDNSYKKIKDIEVGDILYEDGEVTAKMILDANGVEMFDLFGLKISGKHKIKTNGKWIYICHHPNAIKINNYKKSFIYCLNTKSKEINIESNNDEENIVKTILTFNDWDEVFEEELEILSKNIDEKLVLRKDIHLKFDVGISGNTKIKTNKGEYILIKNVKPGNILYNNVDVYGVVEINGQDLNQTQYYSRNNPENNPILGTDTLHKLSHEYLDKINIEFVKEEKLYYLLTNNGNFYIDDLLLNDYNSAVEIFLLSNNYV